MEPIHDIDNASSFFDDDSIEHEQILSAKIAESRFRTDRVQSAPQNEAMGNDGHENVSGAEEDVPMTFPQRLIEILGNEEISDIISWLPHGKGFLIYKKKKFAQEVLPKYFKQSKFTSFTRKLNRWGFSRVTRGPETGAYYHKLFQRGDLRLCMQMSCQTVKLSSSSINKGNMNVHNFFSAQDVAPADLAQQSENMIRQQLHQLQLQQMQLQQLQLQQQQLQAAGMMRTNHGNKHNEVSMMDCPTQPLPLAHSQLLDMYQLMNSMNQQQMQHQPKEDALMGLKTDNNSLLMQALNGKDSSFMSGAPIALLPALGAEAFNRPSMMMEQNICGYRTSAPGNGRAWAA